MSNFYFLGGVWRTAIQAAAWRKEQNRLAEIFCHWCISKGNRHTGDCLTRNEDFDPETTPKLTKEERDQLLKQKDETINKTSARPSQPASSKGKLDNNDGKGGHSEKGSDQPAGNDGSKDGVK